MTVHVINTLRCIRYRSLKSFWNVDAVYYSNNDMWLTFAHLHVADVHVKCGTKCFFVLHICLDVTLLIHFVYSKEYCLWRGITIVDIPILMVRSLMCSDSIDTPLYSRSNRLYLVLPTWTSCMNMYEHGEVQAGDNFSENIC